MSGIIAAALLYPWNSGVLSAQHASLPNDRPLFVICAGGSRSSLATTFLVDNGHTSVHNVAGGINGWKSAHYPTVLPQQAAAYCAWVGGRLPTDEEWLLEASNGETRTFPWGDATVDCARAIWDDESRGGGCGRGSTWPVCSKKSGNSVSGLCDMAGNLWRWTSGGDDQARVVRGGSWRNKTAAWFRADHVTTGTPTNKPTHYGIRCVRPAP